MARVLRDAPAKERMFRGAAGWCTRLARMAVMRFEENALAGIVLASSPRSRLLIVILLGLVIVVVVVRAAGLAIESDEGRRPARRHMSAEGRGEQYGRSSEVLQDRERELHARSHERRSRRSTSAARGPGPSPRRSAHCRIGSSTTSAAGRDGGTGTGTGGASPARFRRGRSTAGRGAVRSAIFGIDDAVVIVGLASWPTAPQGARRSGSGPRPPAEDRPRPYSADPTGGGQRRRSTEARHGRAARQGEAHRAGPSPRGDNKHRTCSPSRPKAAARRRGNSVECGKTAMKATVSRRPSPVKATARRHRRSARASARATSSPHHRRRERATERAAPAARSTRESPRRAPSLRRPRETVSLPAIRGVTPTRRDTGPVVHGPTLSRFASTIDAKIGRRPFHHHRRDPRRATERSPSISPRASIRSWSMARPTMQVVRDPDRCGPRSSSRPTVAATSYSVDTSAALTVPHSIAENTCAKGDCSACPAARRLRVTLPRRVRAMHQLDVGVPVHRLLDPTCVGPSILLYQSATTPPRVPSILRRLLGRGAATLPSASAAARLRRSPARRQVPGRRRASSEAIGTPTSRAPAAGACAGAIKK